MNQLEQIKQFINDADAVVLGAGAGLSTSAGFIYSGPRFQKYFFDFEKKYGFHDMYSGGFNDYESLEEMWAYWSRLIYINRYMTAPVPVYEKILELLKNKNYFVITTNVDHCFQKVGIDKKRMFYTQGDYGLWQCCKPCHKKTYDNGLFVEKMVREQGFRIAQDGNLELSENGFDDIKMSVPSSLVPKCPECGEPMSMNLRSDNTFVEDEGWIGRLCLCWGNHDSLPHTLELSKKGYNAFALIYRPGAQTACQDLARAIAFLHQNSFPLGIDMTGFSLWGGSAGARMAAWLGSLGTEYFDEQSYSRPAAVIMQYTTGLSEVYGNEPATYNCVGDRDGIANYRTMQNRISRIKAKGTDAQIEVFTGLGHGFGLGQGTVAEGWLDNAVKF